MDEKTESELSFPYPISASLRRLRMIDDADYFAKHTAYGDLFESLVKVLSIFALQDFRSRSGMPVYVQEFLRGLLHPSLGHWVQLIRMISSEHLRGMPIAAQIRDFALSKVSAEARVSPEAIGQILQSNQKIQCANDVLDLLVNYRNKAWKGHGASVSADEYQERVRLLASIVGWLLEKSRFLQDLELIYVDEVVKLPTNEFKHRLKLCSGSQIEPLTISREFSLTPERLYLRSRKHKADEATLSRAGSSNDFLLVHPLLTFYTCKACKTSQVFIFNDYHKSRLEFLSYACGHLIYPDMLSDDFESNLGMDLPRSGIEAAGDISSDEIALERGEELLAAAIVRLSAGQYFDALDYIRQSVAHSSTSEANYYGAMACMLTKSSVVEGVYYLETSLQLDPNYGPAKTLQSRIANIMPESFDIRNASEREKLALQSQALQLLEPSLNAPQVHPFFFYATPAQFRGWALQFWIVLAAMFFGFRELSSKLMDVDSSSTVQLLKFLLLATLLIFYDILAKSMHSVYFALLQQTSGKMREHFSNWFSDQIGKTFGRFKESGPLMRRLNIEDPDNLHYLRVAIVLFVLAVAGSIWLTCYDMRNPTQITFEVIDYVFLWGVLVPGAPGVQRCFRLLKEYSKLPLRPMISAVNEYSLNRVGRMIFIVSIPWAVCFSLLTCIGYLTFSKNLVFSQLALFYFMVGFGLIWTFLTPIYLARALGSSKEKILATYGEHLDVAFRRFLEAPTSENSERFRWLKDQQVELLRIRGSSMSKLTFAGLVVVNAYVLGVASIYPLLKFNIKPNQIYENVLEGLDVGK